MEMTDVNLAPINDGYWYTDNPWGTSCPSSTYGVFYDYSTTHNGAPTWRLDPISSNWGIDHIPIPVNVGDHIVMSCWIKTGGSTPVSANGARIGMDWYTTKGPTGWDRIGAANNYYEAKTGRLDSSHDLDADSFVNWGSDWTYLEWDFYIQDEYASDGWYYPTNTMVQATHMLPWIGVVSQSGYPNGAYTCWFSDFKFYINPSDPFVEQVQTPTFSPVSGVYGSTQTVTISSTTPSTTIYYTNDGSTPTSMDFEYTVPISIEYTTTVKALATKSGYTDSAVSTALYTINNPVTPSAAAVRAHLAMLRRR